MPKRKTYNRDLLRHLMDDEAEAPRGDSNIDDLFDSTEDDENATSSVDDDLLSDSDDEKVSLQQRKILKQFNAPGYRQYPLSSWSLTVSKVSSDIALPSLDAVFNFIVSFCNRGGISTEVGKRAHRLHLQGVFQTLFPTSPDAFYQVISHRQREEVSRCM